jgi:GNAT superfamily N-acetyltransferase
VSDGPATYAEPARSYAGLWIIVALFAAGFGVDAVLGGAVAHLLGWAIAFAIVAGAGLLLLYAVRATRSLRLTGTELRVGDEVVARADIVAVASDVDETDLPVLGWPNGRPRGVHAVVLRLADGRDLLVPTRFPERLSAALGVGAVDGALDGARQEVRAAARSELPLLAELDKRAEAVFRAAGYALPDLPLRDEDVARARAVFVAGRPPVGFVLVHEVDGLAHVDEIAVLPRWMRQGIGGRLLERACEWARTHDYPAITLITYADVPWNAPFYRTHGFAELTELTPGLVALREEEAQLGLDALGRRIVMRRELA